MIETFDHNEADQLHVRRHEIRHRSVEDAERFAVLLRHFEVVIGRALRSGQRESLASVRSRVLFFRSQPTLFHMPHMLPTMGAGFGPEIPCRTKKSNPRVVHLQREDGSSETKRKS